MSSDIVKRLRCSIPYYDMSIEAADRIEALEGENAALKKTNAEWLKENAPGGWIDIFRSQAREYGARAERLRVALDKAAKFIADQFATDEDEDNGEWLAKEAREIYATLCKALEDKQ